MMKSVSVLTFISLGVCLHAYGQNAGVSRMKISEDFLHEAEDKVTKITVSLTSSLRVCSDKFLSIAIDTYSVKQRWQEFQFGSQKLQNLAAAMSPANLRLGGTYADFLIFDPTVTEEDLDVEQQDNSIDSERDFNEFEPGFFGQDVGRKFKNFTMTGKMWENLTTFFSRAGWDLMFDFNLFLWKDGLWNTSNAELLLNYSAAREILIPGFQLGNEPNSYHHNFNFSIGPDILLKDLKILQKLISKYPLYKDSALCGPDVTKLAHPSSRSYLQGFMDAGAADVVEEISLHFYYLNGHDDPKEEDFLNVEIMDYLKFELETALNITHTSSKPPSLRFTETASCCCGGAPGLSDRYLAGFMWLDQLGLSALYGVQHVFRQSFIGGNHALLSQTLDPTPDFYLSLIYKRLIEGPVLNVSTEPLDRQLRVYANCARRVEYQAGALVLYFLNLRHKSTTLSMSQFEGKDLDLYLLTPGDSQGLKSSFVKLNGVKLLMQGSLLPQLLPKPHRGDITVDGQSFGFVVVPNANYPLCVEYYKQRDKERQSTKD